MEPPLDKQGCNETVGDEAEYIAARGFPSRDLSLTDWMSGGRIDRPTDVNCCTFCFDCVLLLTKCCSCLSWFFSPLWTIKIFSILLALSPCSKLVIVWFQGGVYRHSPCLQPMCSLWYSGFLPQWGISVWVVTVICVHVDGPVMLCWLFLDVPQCRPKTHGILSAGWINRMSSDRQWMDVKSG